jgi:hypothetical protein
VRFAWLSMVAALTWCGACRDGNTPAARGADGGGADDARTARDADGGSVDGGRDGAGVDGGVAAGQGDDANAEAPSVQRTQDSRSLSQVSTGPAVGRRLTREEYFNSLETTLGVQLDPDDHDLPRDPRAPRGFRNSAPDMLLSLDHVRAYRDLTAVVATRVDVTGLTERFGGCALQGERCYGRYVDGIGTLLLRRPPQGEERAGYLKVFDGVESGELTLQEAAVVVMRAMLMSPRFLYRLEYQSGEGATRAIDDYELATRLSFLVWNAAPDAELIDLAQRGVLGAELEAQLKRLLEHPRARRALRQYVEQWLHLDSIPAGVGLAEEMKQETYRLVEWLVWERDAELMRIFAEPRTEVSGELAGLYGFSGGAPGATGDTRVYDLTQVPERAGILSHAGVIVAHTINPATSMIDRGLFVLNDVFCDAVPPPEGTELRAAIEENMIPEDSGLSQRERFALQREDPLCASCHGSFDPLGEPFEVFGAFGEHLLQDAYGNELTGAGHVTLRDVDASYSDFTGFSEAIAGSRHVARCLVERSVQHAWGRPLSAGDAPMRDEVFAAFRRGGGTYRALIRAIALHDDFRKVEVAP